MSKKKPSTAKASKAPAKITLKQIAEQAGVSVSTVSHIMGSRGHLYTPETREKVTSLAHKLGYRPNAFARAIRAGRFGSVSLLLSNNPAYSNLVAPLTNGIYNQLEKNKLHMSLAILPDEKLTDQNFVPQILREWMADGLLIAYYHTVPKPFRDLLSQHNIPSVWINSTLETDCVSADDFTCGKQATEHLLRLGHKQIAFVDYTVPNPCGNTLHDRFKGYAAAMGSAGLMPRRIGGRIKTPRENRIDKSRKWLSRRDRPTAVVCLFESSALPVMEAAFISGLSVPADLSLITFADEPLTSTGIHITSMQTPFYEIGKSSVAMLVRKLAQPDIAQPSEVLPFTLDQGATCCSI